MNRMIKVLAVAVLATVATPAMAQSTRTFVSSTGDDAQPCSRTAPCRTFATAFDRTATNGEINVIDTGSYGPITITRSLTIRAVGVEAGVIINAGSAITINAGASDRVTLQGLDIEGLTTGTNGIRILQAGDVLIEDVRIHRFSFAGVAVQTASNTTVTVYKSTLQSNGSGLRVDPAGIGSGHAKVLDTLIVDSTNAGLLVDGTGNDIEFAGTRIFGGKAYRALNGGIVRSFGGNVYAGSDPTETVPQK